MKRSNRIATTAFVLIIGALPLRASRREYVVTWQGQRKAGSEVCFYRGSRGDAFTLFFSAKSVRCLPADAILDVPPGLIHVFARHKDGFASMQRDYGVDDEPPRPERGYAKFETPLVRAGIIDFADDVKTLQPNQRLGIWISSTATTTGTFIPLVDAEATVVAPAEVRIVPLRITDGIPTDAGEPLYLEPGDVAKASFTTRPGVSDVIVWPMVDVDSVASARGLLAAPTITLLSAQTTFRPVAPLYSPESATLLVFRGVPTGIATLVSTGSVWKEIRREIHVLDRPVTPVREPVPLIAGGTLVVQWTARPDQAPAADCAPSKAADPPMMKVELRACAEQTCEVVVARRAVRSEALDPIEFPGLAAGTYRLIVKPPLAEPRTFSCDVAAGRETTMTAAIPSFPIFGTVTMNGAPIAAHLTFASGEAFSGTDGRYSASLAADPLANEIDVQPCGESRTLTYTPTGAPLQNSVYDVDLRFVIVKVEVRDPEGRPIAGAAVRYSPIRETHAEGTETYFGSAEKSSDAKGIVTFDDVPAGFDVSVCARDARFPAKCEAFDPLKLEGRTAVLRLDRSGLRGRMEGHSGEGVVAAVGADGVELEEVSVRQDGTFSFRNTHAAPEYLVYVSSTRPLTVIALPHLLPPELAIRMPDVPVRSFTVAAPALNRQDGFIGMWIGERYVPLQVLDAHMQLRGLDSMLHPGKSVAIRDVAETAPISIALGVLPPAARDFVDVFTLPQYAGVKRERVDRDLMVVSGR